VSGIQASKPVVAAFDFDGTLTRRDSLLPFLISLLGTAKVVTDSLALSPTLLGYALRLIPNDTAKESVFVKCMSGKNINELQQSGVRFAQEVLPGLLRSEATQRFLWHKQQGHRCVVISASLELYVRPWAINSGFDDVIATGLEVLADQTVSGKLSGKNCYGIEKVRRLKALLGQRDHYTLYVYGDSSGDQELLSYADHGFYRKFSA